MRALASPASCKGALSAVEAALALAAGMRAGGLDDRRPVFEDEKARRHHAAERIGCGHLPPLAADARREHLGRPLSSVGDGQRVSVEPAGAQLVA